MTTRRHVQRRHGGDRAIVHERLVDINRRRRPLGPRRFGVEAHHGAVGDKPKPPVLGFPRGGLPPGRGRKSLQAFILAERRGDHALNPALGQRLQLIDRHAEKTPPAAQPEPPAIVLQHVRDEVVRQSIIARETSEQAVLF